jgi:DNA (cytosine-5)-methyltransferase 1
MTTTFLTSPLGIRHAIPSQQGGITHLDEFSGIGGISHGAQFVPWVETTDAANHDPEACQEHARNFPTARHYQADVTKLDVTEMPRVDLFTASPACPAWTTANGVKRDFDRANAEQEALFELPGAKPDDPKLLKRIKQYKRSRLLMKEIPRYLRAMAEREPNNPVLIGFLENVPQCRLWAEWDTFIDEIHKLDYHTRLIAFDAAHARPVRSSWAPQSRNRLFLAYWHRKLGRNPDWDKWLRPYAWCNNCAEVVEGVQTFKDPTKDMGRYDSQWFYRCPNTRCLKRVEPQSVPALAAIDLARPGVRIGDREKLGMPELKPNTTGRIEAGKVKHWGPLVGRPLHEIAGMMVPVGGTWRGDGTRGAVSLAQQAPARTTRETDGVAFPAVVPPMMIPVEARAELDRAHPTTTVGRTVTTRAETGLAMVPPFIATMRGGGSTLASKSTTEPAGAVTASGNHHGLAMLPPMLMRNTTPRGGESRCTPVTQPSGTVVASARQSLLMTAPLLVPYYGTAAAGQPVTEPCGTLTTRERYGLASTDTPVLTELPTLENILFRMLDVDEIGLLMGFDPRFRNEAKSKRSRVRLYGNAVCPSIAELIVSALVECMTGESLERDLVAT